MTPFYYVHTPRNIFGENLVGPSIHQPPYEVLATHTGCTVHFETKDLSAAKEEARRLDLILATEMAYAMYI